MYSKTTKKINITVKPYYLEDQSEPEDQHYVWAYKVTIDNQGNEKVQLVAGFHEGMTAMFGTDPETADNLELGVRYSEDTTNLEAFYFESDYQSLKAACTNSQGGSCDEGDIFDGGEVDVVGIEIAGSMIIDGNNGTSFPLGLTFTSTDAAFGNNFDC